MIKTIKLKSDEFFTLDEIKPLPYIIVGGRGTGKSYSVKKYVSDMCIKSNFKSKYMYVRTNKNEISTHDSWLYESGITTKLSSEFENVEIIRGKPTAGFTSLVYDTVNGKGIQHIGYVSSLENSALIKSGYYGDVDCIIFEEFIRNGFTQKQIENYTFNFLELVETVRRDREIPIFMIANNLNSFNPLLSAFSNFIYYKIFTDQRRNDIENSHFKKYLMGELYSTGSYNIDDFNYMYSIEVNNNILSLHVDKYYGRDILITNTKNNSRKRIDLLYNLKRNLVYNFDTMKFIFNNEKTEIFFYTNISKIKDKIRNIYKN